jgi:hypothetical protein
VQENTQNTQEINMEAKNRFWQRVFAASGLCTLLGAAILLILVPPRALAWSPLDWWRNRHACSAPFIGCGEDLPCMEVGGAWYWLRSPEEEKRVVSSLFNRYCIRCHGGDGRGVWDIPGVPNFANAHWQASRKDGQLARAILEGRGAVMPPWRGTLSLEEAWAMARYVRTFIPGTETSRPDFGQAEKPASTPQAPEPQKQPEPQKRQAVQK